LAEGYTASNETSFVNAYYERPAMLALAGERGWPADSRRWLRLWPSVRGAARPGRRRAPRELVFRAHTARTGLELIDAKTYRPGVIRARYRPSH
jgi:hypothetical protein